MWLRRAKRYLRSNSGLLLSFCLTGALALHAGAAFAGASRHASAQPGSPQDSAAQIARERADAIASASPDTKLDLKSQNVKLYNFRTGEQEDIRAPYSMGYNKGLDFVPRLPGQKIDPNYKALYDSYIHDGKKPYVAAVRTMIDIHRLQMIAQHEAQGRPTHP